MLRENDAVSRRLRALWALYSIGAADEKLLRERLDGPHEAERAWAVRLLLEGGRPSAAVREKLAEMAAKEPSPFVRLYLASGLQRLPLAQRWEIAERLMGREEDAGDAYLPLMIWYGIEPLVKVDPERFVGLIRKAKMPVIREHVARRVASLAE
jgi:hypothetical protein